MVLVFGSFAASLGGKNRFRLCHKRSTHWVQGMLSSPPPPTPDQLRSIQHVCKTRNVIIPDQLRSIQHVCKCKECYHPPPHPPLTSCVASNMCASARNVIIPPPPTPDQLRSIQHVCKTRNVIIPNLLRSIQHVCKCKECYHPQPVA